MINYRTIGAVILAGGHARRMGGGDKTLLTVGGRTLLEAIIAALDIADVAISANGDPARFARFGLPVLADGAFVGQGPLAGLLAGLTWAADLGLTDVLTVPGDTPLLPPGLARRLAPAPACAASGGRTHHLVALWPVTCRGLLQAFLTNPGKRNVSIFAAGIGMRQVDFPVQGHDLFLNVNTPDDLARVRSTLNRTDNELPDADAFGRKDD
jgi:molybdopterin-guanine dinucleotide biosynthesis protein A